MTHQLYGNLQSINKELLAQLEGLYDNDVSKNEIVSYDIIQVMCQLTQKLNREVAVFINRHGKIEMVTVGSNDLARIPEMWAKRNSEGLSGIRCIHTHPSGNAQLSQADFSALTQMHFDLMAAIGVSDSPTMQFATLQPQQGVLSDQINISNTFSIEQLADINLLEILGEIEKQVIKQNYQVDSEEEKAILVYMLDPKIPPTQEDEIQKELEELAKTAGTIVVGHIVQKKDRPDNAYYIGKGKLEELSLLCQNKQANCIIFEKPLSPSQLNNLTNALGKKVLDKTMLILDIFAQRARSREGKLQVELAQLNYLLPRLIGKGVDLSRQGGGVGTRGPGETKLESDRRYIRRKIQLVENELQQVRKHREVQNKSKLQQEVPLISLVGYTNAGKSSLLNHLVDETIYAEDQLFATLDTTTRAYQINKHTKALLTDTVGFIRDLPPQLINAFKATLDELKNATLLIQVVDISNSNWENHIFTVQQILDQLGLSEKDMILVFNKIDQIDEIPVVQINIGKENVCYVSVKENQGIDHLKACIEQKLQNKEEKIRFDIPMDQGHLLNKAYKLGKISELEYTQHGFTFIFIGEKEKISKDMKEFIIME